jgi:hypothetical protein
MTEGNGLVRGIEKMRRGKRGVYQTVQTSAENSFN